MIYNATGTLGVRAGITQAFRVALTGHGKALFPGTKGCTRSRFTTLMIVSALLAAIIATPSRAAIIELDLTCTLNGLKANGTCSAGPSFGTVTLEDLSGVDAGKVEVTVDLGFPNTQKFRDLILNYSGTATSISATDGGNPLLLDDNGYSINPYDGLFDLGGTESQGWHATTSGAYSTVLSGNAPLSTADFATLDSLGNLYAAIHIQAIGSASGGNCDGAGNPAACVPGMEGTGSLKIGAPDITIIPEPATVILLGFVVSVGVMGSRRSRL